MVANYALLWWFSFLKCQRWYPNMFSRPNFWVSICLPIIGRIAPIARIYYTSLDTKSEGERSLKRKTFDSFLWLLKAVWSLQEFSKPLREFLKLLLVCKEISPRYGNDKNKVFFSTVINWGRLINNLSTIVLKLFCVISKWQRIPVF